MSRVSYLQLGHGGEEFQFYVVCEVHVIHVSRRVCSVIAETVRLIKTRLDMNFSGVQCRELQLDSGGVSTGKDGEVLLLVSVELRRNLFGAFSCYYPIVHPGGIEGHLI